MQYMTVCPHAELLFTYGIILNLENTHDRKLMFIKYNMEEYEIKGELSVLSVVLKLL